MEEITNRQGIAVMTMFILGSTVLLGVGNNARQDIWVAVILAAVAAIPVMAVYARVLSLFPESNLYEVLNNVFGGFFGRIVAIPYIWYPIHVGALVIRNLQEFIKTVALPETPEFVSVLFMGVLCIWVAKEGLEVLGRWSHSTILFLFLIIVIDTLLSVPNFNADNLRPFLYNGFKPVLMNAFSVFSFPFAETVIFTAVFNVRRNSINISKVFFSSLLISTITILILSMRNLLIFGANFIQILYFPSYTAISLINVSEFLQRIEVSVSVVFLFSVFVKASICLIAAGKGLTALFKLDDYKQIAAPAGLLMMVLSCFIYKNIMEMIEWLDIYMYYAFPFQVILPVIIWVFAEIKAKKLNRS